MCLTSWGFPDSSVCKEPTCNAGDLGLIPGSGRSAGEGVSSPLQYSWAFLVSQLVKNLPALWETWLWSLGWEEPLEKGKATHSSILAWRIPCTVQSRGHKELDTTERLSLSLYPPKAWFFCCYFHRIIKVKRMKVDLIFHGSLFWPQVLKYFSKYFLWTKDHIESKPFLSYSVAWISAL